MSTETKPARYARPPVAIGDPVVWRHTPNGDPAAAIVTAVQRDGISVMVLPPESRVGQPREGVRHVSDPMLPKLVQHDGGCWDYTDLHKLVLTLVD